MSELEQLVPGRVLVDSDFASASGHRRPARLVRGSPDHVCEVISRMLLVETEAEYLGLHDPSHLSRSNVPTSVMARFSRTTRALVDRGIRTQQVTTHRGVAADAENCPSLQWRAGGGVRVVDRLPLTACVIDRRFALVPVDLAVLVHGMLVVTDPVVVGVLVAVHRSLWLRGRDPAALDGVPAHLRPVLMTLAAGLPDGRAAEYTGLSPRTYSRRIAELVQLLGASSRFDAGVEAARRGWL